MIKSHIWRKVVFETIVCLRKYIWKQVQFFTKLLGCFCKIFFLCASLSSYQIFLILSGQPEGNLSFWKYSGFIRVCSSPDSILLTWWSNYITSAQNLAQCNIKAQVNMINNSSWVSTLCWYSTNSPGICEVKPVG